MPDKKTEGLLNFIDGTISYFLAKAEGVDRDVYFADRDKRYILDKSINDIILCLVDINFLHLQPPLRLFPTARKIRQ